MNRGWLRGAVLSCSFFLSVDHAQGDRWRDSVNRRWMTLNRRRLTLNRRRLTLNRRRLMINRRLLAHDHLPFLVDWSSTEVRGYWPAVRLSCCSTDSPACPSQHHRPAGTSRESPRGSLPGQSRDAAWDPHGAHTLRHKGAWTSTAASAPPSPPHPSHAYRSGAQHTSTATNTWSAASLGGGGGGIWGLSAWKSEKVHAGRAPFADRVGYSVCRVCCTWRVIQYLAASLSQSDVTVTASACEGIHSVLVQRQIVAPAEHIYHASCVYTSITDGRAAVAHPGQGTSAHH